MNEFDWYDGQTADSNNNDLLPAGWYSTQITKAEMGTAKTGSRRMHVEFTVVGANYANRKIFKDYYAFGGRNPDVGRRQIKALGVACGITSNVTGPESFNGKLVSVKVRITPAEGDYPARNDVVDYKTFEQPNATPAPQQTAPKAPEGKAPWM